MSRDKDALTKFKAFFKSSRSPNIELAEFVLTPEREQELCPRNPIQQRIRSLDTIARELQSKRLEAGSLHKLWELTQDLLNGDRAVEHRQAGFNFYQKLIASQYDNLSEMRVHFFRIIQEHTVSTHRDSRECEDIEARLSLLNTLTNTGKNIKLIDKDIGDFMLHWAPAVLEANLMAEYLEITINMIRFNAACLEKPVIAGIVNLCCGLMEKGEDLVPKYLSLIDAVIAYSLMPMESLSSCIVALCRTGACQEYSLTSYDIMRRLLGTALGHATIWTMCCLLNDESRRRDEKLLCGAVYYTNLSLWGPSPAPTASLRFSISVVLKSFLEVIQLGYWHVSYEVLKSVQQLIEKQGSHLNELTWDLVVQILDAAVNNNQHVVRSETGVNNQIPVLFHETVTVAEGLLADTKIRVDPTNFFDLIERIKDHRDERSVALLMSHKLEVIVVTRPKWIHSLGQFVERFYRHEQRTNVRVMCVENVKTVMRLNRAAYEDEILERVILSNFASVVQERDVVVRKAVNRMILDFARACDTKRSMDLLHIVETQMNSPFSTQLAVSSSACCDPETMVAVVEGLIDVFLVKLYVRPMRPDEVSSHATQVFHMLVGHLERHYDLQTIGDYSEVRYRLFEWMFKARANASFRVGFPDPATGVVRFSQYLGIDARKPIIPLAKDGSGELPQKEESSQLGDHQRITTISIRRGCKVIVKCLEQENCWRVLELVLVELPKILQNKALIEGNDVNLLGTTLCSMFKNRKSVAEQCAPPPGYTAQDIHSLLLSAMTTLMAYHQTLDVMVQKQLLDCLVNGGISLQLANITVPAMTVMLLEIPDMIFRFVPDILLVLSKLSSTPNVAVPVLEFLSTLTRLPQARFGNFTSSQSLYVFAVALPYTNPYRYNHYIISLAHHVIAGWFLKSRQKFRYNFVKYIVTGLDQHIDKAFPMNASALVNEDSSNRKRSSSLKERGTGKERSGAGGGKELVLNTNLHEFHMELAETCIDFMAKHTYSPCVAQPKRLPTTNFMLAGGQSMSWLLGHNLITITTSGCAGVAKNGICDRCAVFCKVPSQQATTGGTGATGGGGNVASGFGLQKSAQDSESSDLTSTTSTSSTNLSAANPQQRFLLQRQSSSEGAGRFSSNSGSLETLPRRGSNPDAAEGGEGPKDHLNHPIAGGVSSSSSTVHLQQAQDPMIRQLCSCSCVGWAEIVVRRPTGSMSWVMRIQNQMYQDLFAVDDVFPTLHDISNLFMPSFGAMSLSVRGDSEEGSPSSLVVNAGGQAAGKEVEKLAQAAGFNFGEKSSVDEVQKVAPGGTIEDAGVVAAGGGGGGHKATASGPIAIPKQAKAAKESGSFSDRDSDDGIGGDEDENHGRRAEDDGEGDGEYDDEEGGRSRNPVRRVNSSPEMRSNYRNPYLLNKQQQKDKDGGSTNSTNPTGSGIGGGALATSSVEGTEGGEGVEGGGGAPGGQQQWKKGGGGYSKDMRVSCEAIPEEMTGQTPPSKTGSVASSESVLTGAETTAVLLRDPGNKQENENKVKGGSSESATTLAAKKEDVVAEGPAAKSSPMRQRQPQMSTTAEEGGALKLQVNLIAAEKPASTSGVVQVVTAKPPQSPAPLSPRLLSKTSSMSHRIGGMMTMMDGGVGGGPMGGGHMMPFGGGPPVGDDEIRRGRSNTISVVQERHTKHSTLRGRNAGGGPGGSGPGSGGGSSGLGSTVSSSGSIPSRTSGRSSVGGGGPGLDGALPRPSGISPSFVFLQLFHSDQKPLRVDAANEKALKMLDLIPPMEVYKIGVLYVGPGQVDKEQEILRNRCGSYRYTKFLSGLGSLLSVEQAKVGNTYTSLDPTNPMDGKFTYIWQDDIAQLQFHVATLMPTREETDPKCATKKLHIGNDYVMIIYNESGEVYAPSTFVTQFNYVSVVVEPLEMRSNRISVKVRDNLIDNKWEAKIVSDECAPLLARQLALHANLASLVCQSLKPFTNVPYASSWLERLRSLKRLRKKIVESNRNEGSGSGMMGASDHHQQQPQQPGRGGVGGGVAGGVGGVSPQALARKYQMDDFTTYTQ